MADFEVLSLLLFTLLGVLAGNPVNRSTDEDRTPPGSTEWHPTEEAVEVGSTTSDDFEGLWTADDYSETRLSDDPSVNAARLSRDASRDETEIGESPVARQATSGPLPWESACAASASKATVDVSQTTDRGDAMEAEAEELQRLNRTIPALYEMFRRFPFNRTRTVYWTVCIHRLQSLYSTPSSNPSQTNTSEAMQQVSDIMCQLNQHLMRVAYLVKVVNDSQSRTVPRDSVIPKGLSLLAFEPSNGIYPNLCRIQAYIETHQLTCPSSTRANSTDNITTSKCRNLEAAGTLLEMSSRLVLQN